MHIPFPANTLQSLWLIFTAMLVGSAAGCGGPSETAPKFDPEEIAQRAMAEYDKNKDGRLEEGELELCPALKRALPNMTEKDFLTQENISQRLLQFQKSAVVLMDTRCRVIRDGRGVQDVTVTFIPEKFMGETIKTGSGITDEDGYASLSVNLGYYRIEASKKDEGGMELMPPWLNKDSKYGQEVAHARSFLTVLYCDQP